MTFRRAYQALQFSPHHYAMRQNDYVNSSMSKWNSLTSKWVCYGWLHV